MLNPLNCFNFSEGDDGEVRRRGRAQVSEESATSGPGWFPRWAPTSELELYQAEAAILNPIRPMISQRTVAGLNTISSVHPKVKHTALFNAPEMATIISSSSSTPLQFPPKQEQTAQLLPLDEDNFTTVVFVHGYAGGVANWLPVWKDFAAEFDVHAFDLPGFARSERRSGKPFTNAQDGINWYIGHFEKWFEAMRIGVGPNDTTRPAGRKIVLVGHSFGGYLCSNFAMRHPEIVDHLVLADAWGVHRHVPLTPEEEAAKKAEQSYATQLLTRAMNGIYWSKLLRGMGPAALMVFTKARPEFMDTWSPFLDDPKHFYDYTYHCNAQTPHTGERAFGVIRCPLSGPFAAQMPLYTNRGKFPVTFSKSSETSAHTTETAASSPPTPLSTPTGLVAHGHTSRSENASPAHTNVMSNVSSRAVSVNPIISTQGPFGGGSIPSTLSSSADSARSHDPFVTKTDMDDVTSVLTSHNANLNRFDSVNSICLQSPDSSPTTTAETNDTGHLRISPAPSASIDHAHAREGFKMTLLYGETSWLRTPDVEDLASKLREEKGTDITYSVIPKAGHMVMVDNAASFTEELMRRIR